MVKVVNNVGAVWRDVCNSQACARIRLTGIGLWGIASPRSMLTGIGLWGTASRRCRLTDIGLWGTASPRSRLTDIGLWGVASPRSRLTDIGLWGIASPCSRLTGIGSWGIGRNRWVLHMRAVLSAIRPRACVKLVYSYQWLVANKRCIITHYRMCYMFLNMKRDIFQSMLHIPALLYFDTWVTYPEWFRTGKFVTIPPRFV